MVDTVILGINETVDGVSLKTTANAFGQTGFNTGNLAFHYAINRILGGQQSFLEWRTPTAALNASGKTIIFPCANNLGPHADFGWLALHFSELKVPIVAIGLGAQAGTNYALLPEVPDGTLNWVREMAARSLHGKANIGLRGSFTLKLLQHYGLADRAVVTGCPTLFINPDPALGQTIARKLAKPCKRIAVAGGHQGWTGLSQIEKSLTTIMTASGGSYIVQSPEEMINLARGEADLLPEEKLIKCRDYVAAGMGLDEFKTWSRAHLRVYFNVSEWMECLRGHDFVVGTRIHGVMLGLQAGIPGLCIVHDSRTRELCETLMVPHVMAADVQNGFTLDELLARFTFDARVFDENRRQIAANFGAFLQGNDIAPGPLLTHIAAPPV